MTGVQPVTLGDIIEKFELQVNDLTELSTDEEIDLANDKYQVICDERPWLFLRRFATGALQFDATVNMWYVPVPDDFKQFAVNDQATDNTFEVDNNADPMVIYIGQNNDRIQIINYIDRMRFRQRGGVCWLDPNKNKIYFPITPPDTSLYQFDYICIPPDLEDEDTDEPLFPVRFRILIVYLMAMDNEILQRSSLANSQASQNNLLYQDRLGDMQLWDAEQYHY